MSHGLFYRCPCVDRGNIIAVYGGSESSRISSKIICVLKMNEGLMGLERHEGELTEFSFLSELSL